MIILTAAMLKAGSSWLYNQVNDLMIMSGHQDGREIRKRFRLQKFLSAADCTTRTLRFHRLTAISMPHLLGNSFTIKTHGRPTPSIKNMISLGMMKTLYIYRDPRDVTLSLYDHGEWIRREGIPSGTRFDILTTIEKAMDVLPYYLQIWEKWVRSKRVLILRYEDLLREPHETIRRITSHIGIDVQDQDIERVVDRYSIKNRDDWKHDLHFNVGKMGRWKEKMTPAQKRRALELFKDYLPKMGYPL
jgi:hypothetical protein